MHRFSLEHRVSHADVDLLGELKTQSLLGLLEQAAVEASADVGLDPAAYTRSGRVWIIRRTRLERRLPVGGGDTVAVHTEVADWRRARSLRRYEVRLAAPGRGIRRADVPAPEPGAVVARATTDWVFCDIATGRPVSVPEDVRRAFSGDGLGETLPRARALPDAGEGAAVEMGATVRVSRLDHVTHVNNAAYAGLLEDGAFELFGERGLSAARMLETGGALRLRSLDVEYLVDALAGDELLVRTWLVAGAGLGGSPDTRLPGASAPSHPTDLDASVRGGGDAAPASPPAARDGGGPGGTPRATLLQAIDRSDGTRLMRAASEWSWLRRPAILGGVPEP